MQLQLLSLMNLGPHKPGMITNRKRKPPAWKLKIEKDIETKRKELSIITSTE